MSLKSFLLFHRKCSKEESEEDSLNLLYENIKKLINKHFNETNFGYIYIDSKKIKLYASTLGNLKCLYTRNHKYNFFVLGNFFKKTGYSEVDESAIPEIFQKQYFNDEIWLFEVNLKSL